MQVVTITYRSTNYYLLDNGKIKLLVDAGWPGNLAAFKHALQTKGINITGINYLLITHYHPDHAGLAQELKELGVKLIAIDCQLPFIPALENYIKPGSNHKPIIRNDNIVITIEGSRQFLNDLGFNAQILHTPGHSDDSITLVLDTGEAFTGDLPPNYFTGDATNEVDKSWQKLGAAGVNKIYPGHGPARFYLSR